MDSIKATGVLWNRNINSTQAHTFIHWKTFVQNAFFCHISKVKLNFEWIKNKVE